MEFNFVSFRREVYLPYKHVDWIPKCQPHPGNIVEPASLAVIDSALSPSDGEDISESLPSDAVTGGKLSSLQLESVLKAVSRLKCFKPHCDMCLDQ